MNKTNLEMFKMSKAQMNNVSGGYDKATCKRFQQIANGDESNNWSDAKWEAWADLWHKNCEK